MSNQIEESEKVKPLNNCAVGKNLVNLKTFWDDQVKKVYSHEDFKAHALPLARIKKIMKMDEEVKMISAEVPVILSKACEIFINELSIRSWSECEASHKKTVQKSDISAALSRSDQYDFLIDIVPREAIGHLKVKFVLHLLERKKQ